MDPTVIVAALGFVATLLATSLASRWQRLGAREARLFDARVRSYSDCAGALYEYERAVYHRVKTRFEGGLEQAERAQIRQQAWSSNAAARAAIAPVSLLSSIPNLSQDLEAVRSRIGDMNDATGLDDLLGRHSDIQEELHRILATARADLAA